MNIEEYRDFTIQLKLNCQKNERIVGLVSAGSMAEIDYAPDQWSDHDFFVVAKDNQQEFLKKDLSWLPDHHNIVYQFPESQHGVKAIYRNFHLIEFAIFDEKELKEARVNRYRVLVDKTGVAEIMASIARETIEFVEKGINPGQAMVHFISNIWVGYGRYHRGERLSAHEFVKFYSLLNLLKLIQTYHPGTKPELLDNLNPFRRFELCYPQIGAELNEAILLDTPKTCKQFLYIAEKYLSTTMPDFPQPAFDVLNKYMK